MKKAFFFVIICMCFYNSKAQSLLILTISDLNFGTFYSQNNMGGTLTLHTNGSTSQSNGVTHLNSLTVSPARFQLTTLSLFGFNVTVSADEAVLTNQFNETITVALDQKSHETVFVSLLTPRLITIGGTLTFPAEMAGTFTGTVEVNFISNNF